MAYVDWLKNATGAPYRLPSEAELEYINRVGSGTPFPWGQNKSGGCEMANGADQSLRGRFRKSPLSACTDGQMMTRPAGSCQAKAVGQHHTSGNAYEWAGDCWHRSYRQAPSDGLARVDDGDCRHHMLRGGSWSGRPETLRAAYRSKEATAGRSAVAGFRVARDF
jgi:formylglycine-generating enzyme required for sulfatase activity